MRKARTNTIGHQEFGYTVSPLCLTAIFALMLLAGIGGKVSAIHTAGPAADVKASGVLKPRQWEFQFITNQKAIRLSVETGFCVGNPEPFIAKVSVVERRRSAVLTAFVEYPSRSHVSKTRARSPVADREEKACAGVGVGLFKTVTLDRVARSIALYDGKTSPPSKRWPRP